MSGHSGRPTRSLITSPDFKAGLLAHNPALKFMSDADRSASLAATLAARPEPGDAWVFAIGSLMWNPPIETVERVPARLSGYRRALCLSSDIGRGSAEQPGLVFAIDFGGSCTGFALRIAADKVAHELDVLWRIEMIDNSYSPRWLPVDIGGRKVAAVTFVMNHAHPRYVRLGFDEIVTRVALARGHFGSCYEYVAHARDALRAAGLRDHQLERITAAAEARMAAG